MSKMKTVGAILAGTVSFGALAANAFESISNTTTIDLAHELEEITVPNAMGGGGNADKYVRVKSVKLTLAVRRVSLAALELAFGGTAALVAAGAVADESHTVKKLDAQIVLDFLPDPSQTLTVSDGAGGAAFDEGVDYERTALGIRPLSGGTIALNDVLSFDYTKQKQVVIEAMLSTAAERAVLIDAANQATGARYASIYHRVSFGPAKGIKWYSGNEYVSFDIEGEALAADFISGDANSKFYRLLVGEDLS